MSNNLHTRPTPAAGVASSALRHEQHEITDVWFILHGTSSTNLLVAGCSKYLTNGRLSACDDSGLCILDYPRTLMRLTIGATGHELGLTRMQKPAQCKSHDHDFGRCAF